MLFWQSSTSALFESALIGFRGWHHVLECRSVPVENIINDIAQMGFDRRQIMSVIAEMQKEGKAIDLNVVISRCLGS